MQKNYAFLRTFPAVVRTDPGAVVSTELKYSEPLRKHRYSAIVNISRLQNAQMEESDMKKKIVSILLAVSMVFALLPGYALAAAAGEGTLPSVLSVEPSEQNKLPAAIDLVLRDKDNDNGDYCLYLPGNTDASACFFSWEGSLNGTEGPRSYESGAMPVPPVGESKTYYFSDGSNETSFTVTTYQGSAAIPPIFIEIDESLGTIHAMNSDPSHNKECTGIIFIDGEEYELDKMKGRGNATWNMAKEKRPYNITLGSKVSSILGIEMPEKTKKFSLLANIADRSLLRNKIGYDMSYAMDIGLDSASADVWMNGEYIGVYLVTPKNDSFITDDGYGIEDDNYTEPPIEQGGDPSFELDNAVQPYAKRTRITVKKIGDNLLPDGESVESLKAASAQIQDYLQDVWDAIRSEDGYNAKGKYYTEYLDMESWAAMYLMQEFVRGFDANAGSLLFHRDGTTEADKLYAGPMWDLDNAVGSNQGGGAHGVTLADANGWFLRNIGDDKGSIYQAIGKHEDFMDEVYRVYNENQAVFDEAAANVVVLSRDLAASAEMNDIRVTKETYNNAYYSGQSVLAAGTEYEQVYKATRSWQDYVDNLETFVSVRAHFFRDNLTREDIVYRGRFNCSIGSSITAFDTRDTSVEGTPNADFAFVRNGETGEPDSSGNGELNFRVDLKPGYTISEVTAIPAANYGEILPLGENLYRITGVTGTITITTVTEEAACDHRFDGNLCTLCGAMAFRADFARSEGCSIRMYETRDFTGKVQYAPASVLARNGETGKADLMGNGEVNFTISVPEGCRVGRISIEPEGNYDQLLRPYATGTPNGYRITGIRGDISVSVETALLTSGVDFTDPASADSFQILQQEVSEIRPGEGLYLRSTREAFEPSTGQLSEFNPKDVVMVSVDGDWIATLHFAFDDTKASNGYYQYFGFYAMVDYENFLGIRGGDGAMQDIRRVNGAITEETRNSTPGLGESGEYWYRMEKSGTDYTCWRSEDGETFTEMFSFTDTGLEAENLCIDAYSGMTEGWEFLLKSLELDGMVLPCKHDYEAVITPPTCLDPGFTTYTCHLCGSSHVSDESAATGHSYEAAVTAPTCLDPGFTTYTCRLCQDSYVSGETEPAGHLWNEGQVTTAPTETLPGVMTYTCTRCSEEKTEAIPVHTHSFLRTELTPTCTQPGLASYTCECGKGYTYDETPALGHDFKDGTCLRCMEAAPNPGHICPGEAFSDLPTLGSWAHAGIDFCVAKGLMQGISDTLFAPSQTLTRAQLVTILYRMAGSPRVESSGSFTDVPEKAWYAKAVTWAADSGIVNGIGQGRFAPGDPITREQIAAILHRFSGKPEAAGSLAAFPDHDAVGSYAAKAMVWAVNRGLITGKGAEGETRLDPKGSATRAEIASIIMRFLADK